MIALHLTNIGPHERVVVPLTGDGVDVRGPSGSGKSSLAMGLCWLLTGLNEHGDSPDKPDPVRDGAMAGEASLIIQRPDREVKITRRRTATGTASGKNGDVAATPTAVTEAFAAMFKFPTAKAAVLVTSPVYWLELARTSGGRPLVDLLTSSLPADTDPLAGLLDDTEPRDVRRAEVWVTDANRHANHAAGVLQEATKALDDFRVMPAPEPVPAEEIEGARALIASYDEAVASNKDAVDAHAAWQRAATYKAANTAAITKWRNEEPKAPPVEQHDIAATLAAQTAAVDVHRAAVERQATVRERLAVARAEQERKPAPVASLPPCATKPGCALAKGAAVTPTKSTEELEAVVQAARTEWDLASAAERAAGRDLEAARKAHEAAKAYKAALESFESKRTFWKQTEPTVAPDPGPEPEVPALPDVTAASGVLARAEERAAAVLRWERQRDRMMRNVETAQTAADEARRVQARAVEVLKLLRGAPAKKLEALVARLELGPVTMTADGDGVAITLFGAPLHRASRGQIVAGGAWLRTAVKVAMGCKLPVVIDEVESVQGLPWPAVRGAVWLRTQEGPWSVEVRGA